MLINTILKRLYIIYKTNLQETDHKSIIFYENVNEMLKSNLYCRSYTLWKQPL